MTDGQKHGKLESYVMEQCHEILIVELDGGHMNICCKSNFFYILEFFVIKCYEKSGSRSVPLR